MAKRKKQQPQETKPTRPPVVTVLGHVDHGKTTLLDTIRKTSIASREHGGITQRIGAYQIEFTTKEGKKKITFIDTPGHEAFAKMRSRGASVADIAILVVSGVDGVMPQTKEAIQHIQAAGIPLIIAVNKMDLPEASLEKVKRELADASVLVEGYGGDTVVVPISAKEGSGITELLDMIVLVSELKGFADVGAAPFSGVVIESKRDRRKGSLATVIVKSGKLHIGDQIVADHTHGKVRALLNSYGKSVAVAEPGDPIEVLGFSTVPPVGVLVATQSGKPERDIVEHRPPVTEVSPESSIKLVIKADSVGTLEAVETLLPPDVSVVSSGVGDITESDVLFAKTATALIVGFGVQVSSTALKLAEFERVMIKTYTVIYELAREMADVVKAIKDGKLEEVLGQGEIMAQFPFDKERVAGTRVKDGRLARGDKIRIEREGSEIGRGKIKSIRQKKSEVNKVETGEECGVLSDSPLDFQTGDVIISYR